MTGRTWADWQLPEKVNVPVAVQTRETGLPFSSRHVTVMTTVNVRVEVPGWFCSASTIGGTMTNSGLPPHGHVAPPLELTVIAKRIGC
ncbi:MAG: hypothetical protein M3501_01675 [Actinomycetota bacterium]|nr:hypothetical protein [Actinomycetota bacterium]